MEQKQPPTIFYVLQFQALDTNFSFFMLSRGCPGKLSNGTSLGLECLIGPIIKGQGGVLLQ